jgi:hypothetical protein
MLDRLASGALSAAASVFKLAAIVVLIVAFIGWAKANPDSAQTAMTKVMDMLASVIGWSCDQIIALTS